MHRSAIIGRGRQVFLTASVDLLSWQMHRHTGFDVVTTDSVARQGAVVLLNVGRRPLRIRVPCRVVYDINEPSRRGFAYGTLPGHPESGEEAFVLEHRENGSHSPVLSKLG